jgi:hypothetical protein
VQGTHDRSSEVGAAGIVAAVRADEVQAVAQRLAEARRQVGTEDREVEVAEGRVAGHREPLDPAMHAVRAHEVHCARRVPIGADLPGQHDSDAVGTGVLGDAGGHLRVEVALREGVATPGSVLLDQQPAPHA